MDLVLAFLAPVLALIGCAAIAWRLIADSRLGEVVPGW
jgi:hypothetical protein